MLRGSWRFILAAIGCLILTGAAGERDKAPSAPKTERADKTSTAALNPPVPKLVNAAKDQADQAQCKNEKGGREDCVTASAQATIDQASYAYLQTIWGFIGLVIGGGTLLAAGAAAYFARNAAIYTKQSAEAAKQAVGLATQEFLATHRPRIILREAITGSFLEGEAIAVMLSFANVGDSVGTIVRSWIRLEIVTPHQDRLFLHASVEPHSDIGEIQLSPGEQRIVNYPHGDAPLWHKNNYSGPQTGPYDYDSAPRSIHLTGQILYIDSYGVQRRTAFRRVLIPEKQRFYRLPNNSEPDLDYAD